MRTPQRTRAPAVALGLLAALTVLKLVFACWWGLLADEAYYWVWSQRPAWGYYDQPPAIIAAVWLGTPLASWSPELAVRAGAVLCGLAPLALLGARELDHSRWLWWCLGLPPLVWLTWFATSDAPLLAGWCLALAGALRGGRWWLLAGLGAGLAVMSKYSGLAVLPLLVVAAGPRSWRSPWPWAGLVVMAAAFVPNVLWNQAHGGVSLWFQLEEGLVNPHAPGPRGVLRQLGDQVAVVSPVMWAVGMAWCAWAARRALTDWTAANRTLRLAWFTSAPLLVFFALAAMGGPPEAHWPAPAWLGVGLGLASRGVPPLLARAVRPGAALGLLATALLTVQATWAPVYLSPDPGTRVTEGRVLAAWVDALPEGPVLTERYQEAAWIAFYTSRTSQRQVGCGRDDQYGIWFPDPSTEAALYIRPARGGPPDCVASTHFYRRLDTLRGEDAQGRSVGSWDAYWLDER